MLCVHFSDIVLYLCEKEHIEGGMIFQLLEDLTEMSTMKNCKDVFGYIESKQDILGKVYFSVVFSPLCLCINYLLHKYHIMICITLELLCDLQQELFARGKLVMLRTCNQLLRRLSKVHLAHVHGLIKK